MIFRDVKIRTTGSNFREEKLKIFLDTNDRVCLCVSVEVGH